MDDQAPQLLRESVARFNSWRKGRPLQLRRADLSGADLSGAMLREADLYGADLSGCRLVGADLANAHLEEANLVGADLGRANLEAAQMSGARLEKATLARCRLRHANLERADLRGADLRGADLRQAILVGTRVEGARTEGARLQGVKRNPGDSLEALDEVVRQLSRRAEGWAWIRRLALACFVLFVIGLGPDWGALLKQGEVKPNPFLAARIDLYLGQRCLLEEKYPEAVRRFQQSVELDPEFREGYVHLAFAYDAVGKHAEADKAFARFLSLKPTPKDLARLRKTLEAYGSPEEQRAIERLLEERGYRLR